MKIASPSECTGCMACVSSCHHQALRMEVDNYGYFQVKISHDRCVECGLCSKTCPIINPITYEKDNISLSKPLAAWTKSQQLRKQAASGGAFAALAELFLKRGGVVYGAAINGFEVCHTRIDCIEKLPLLLGSKYQQSNMFGIYQKILKDLRDGKQVLFGGLSCQVVGVLNYVDTKYVENLYTVDTICGGVSSILPMMKLKESGEYNRIISFRDKSKGWKSKGFAYSLKMETKEGKVVDLGSNNKVINCFNNRLLKRSSCLDCKFNGFHRISDCTIGDFWGDERFPEQHFDGLSVIVFHTNRLKDILGESPLCLSEISWNELIKCNPCYYWSHYPYLRRSLSRNVTLHELKRDSLHLPISDVKKTMLLFKVELSFYYRIVNWKRENYLRKILNKY